MSSDTRWWKNIVRVPGLDQHPDLGVRAVGSVDDPDLEIHQVHVIDLGIHGGQRLAQRIVQADTGPSPSADVISVVLPTRILIMAWE